MESSAYSIEPAAPEGWLLRLKAAYEGGFYKTEAAVGEQTRFPWQGKSCGDCPFWNDSRCGVYGERRSALAHTCCYFDESNRAAASEVMTSHQAHSTVPWRLSPGL